jgi:hypothetical protein
MAVLNQEPSDSEFTKYYVEENLKFWEEKASSDSTKNGIAKVI